MTLHNVNPPQWVVRVAPHVVRGSLDSHRSFDVPGGEFVVAAETEQSAVALGVRAAHVAAGVPGWRPYLRQSVIFVSGVKRAPLTALQEKQQKIINGGGRS